MRTIKNVVLILLLMPFVSLAQSDDELDPSTDTTYDGLVQIKRAGFRNVWINPDVDFSNYSKILPGPPQFHYRNVPPASRSAARTSSRSEFPIEAESRAELEAIMIEAFREEAARSEYFILTDQPAPDTAQIWGGLHDIVSRVPPEPIGRGDIYLREVGRATLVLQIESSMSGEVLVRVVDRRAAESAFPQPSSPVTSRSEARRLARTWARILRNGIDKWHQTGGAID